MLPYLDCPRTWGISRETVRPAWGCMNAFDGLGEDAFKSLLDRLHLTAISWTGFDHAMAEIADRLDPEDPGDQTLMNLLNGFRSQVAEQEGTGV